MNLVGRLTRHLKRTSESERNLSYLDISISICGGKYVTEVYDKRDDFNFDIVNFPYMCSNIPAKPTYGVYISQLIRICRICDNYSSFLLRHKLLTERLVGLRILFLKQCLLFYSLIPIFFTHYSIKFQIIPNILPIILCKFPKLNAQKKRLHKLNTQ